MPLCLPHVPIEELFLEVDYRERRRLEHHEQENLLRGMWTEADLRKCEMRRNRIIRILSMNIVIPTSVEKRFCQEDIRRWRKNLVAKFHRHVLSNGLPPGHSEQ